MFSDAMEGRGRMCVQDAASALPPTPQAGFAEVRSSSCAALTLVLAGLVTTHEDVLIGGPAM